MRKRRRLTSHLLEADDENGFDYPRMVAMAPYRSIDLNAFHKDKQLIDKYVIITPIDHRALFLFLNLSIPCAAENASQCDALYLRASNEFAKDSKSGVNELFVFADGMIVCWDMTTEQVPEFV